MNKRGILIFVIILSLAIAYAASFQDLVQGDFNQGTYNNTEHNGSAVILSSGQLSGTFTSRIFDATSEANWTSLTAGNTTPDLEILYGVDKGGDIYNSSNLGIDWSMSLENFGRTSTTEDMFSNSNYLFILSSSGNEIWRSENGTSFNIINDSFADSSPLLGNSYNDDLYIVDASGDVYLSENSGITWTLQGDFNGGASNNPKGLDINSSGAIFVVDGGGDVYSSIDNGENWDTLTNYGGGSATDSLEIDSNGNIYILFNKDIYKSEDYGNNWNLINDSFTDYSNDGCKMYISENIFFIADCTGRIFNSTDGLTWTESGDLNLDASNNPAGLTSWTKTTSLSLQVKNCTQADCSDAEFQTADLNNINLIGQYFQYKATFTSQDISITPKLYNISLNYNILNTAPTITLEEPQDGNTYGYNESLQINYTVSDTDDNLDSCWYAIDGASNTTLANCQNTTFNISEGSHTLNIYANDTNNAKATDSASFTIAVGAPTISNLQPSNKYLTYYQINFSYTPSDIDLQTCELWINSTGNFIINQTNNVPNNGTQNNFTLNLPDGSYLWNIRCNDSFGNSAFNGNKTITIDTINPEITITQPSGTKSTRTGIPINFTASDTNLEKCWYRVDWQTGGNVISNTSINNCQNTTFSVSSDGDYILNLYSNDSANNFNFSSSNFTIDTSTTTPPTSPSSGGGGGSGGLISIGGLQLSDLGEVVLNTGERKTISLEAKNTGLTVLSNCKISAEGEKSNWISSSLVKDIGGGQEITFPVAVSIPEDENAGDYEVKINLKCKERSSSKQLKISVIKKMIDFELKNLGETSGRYVVEYFLKDFSSSGQDATVQLIIKTLDGEIIADLTEDTHLEPGENKEMKALIDVPSDAIGEHILYVNVDGLTSLSKQETILIGGSGFTGLAIFGENSGIIIPSIVLILIAGSIAFFLVRKIIRSVKEKKSKEGKAGVVKVK